MKETRKTICIRSRLYLCLFLFLFAFGGGCSIHAFAAPLSLSDPYVVDHSGVIPDIEKQHLDDILYQLNVHSKVEFRVVVANTAGSSLSSAYVEKIWSDWSIGSVSGDGILMLYLTDDRRSQIRVSENLTKELPNDLLQRVGRLSVDEIASHGYAQGVSIAVTELIDELGRTRGFSYAEFLREAETASKPIRPQNKNSAQGVSFWAIFCFFGKWALILAGILVGFILLCRTLVGIYEWVTTDSRSRPSIYAGCVALFGLLSVIYFLPRSQSIIVATWKTTSAVKESNFFLDKVFGTPPNHYDADINGRITALYLKDNGLRDLTQVPGIKSLSSLEFLEISDSPLQGTIDVSSLTNLKELHLRNTKVNQVLGLNKLTQLNRLDLEGSPIEIIDSTSSAERFNLSRTRITDLTALSYLPQLKELSLEDMDISQVRGFESLPPIELISLRNCTKIPLGQLPPAQTLILDGSDVTDLSALGKMQTLQIISIFDTNVHDLHGLEKNNILAINTDNLAFTSDALDQFFGHKVIVSRVNLATLSISSFFPKNIWQYSKLIGTALLTLGLVVLLPLPFGWQRPELLIVRRVTLFMIPGALLTLFLLLISNIDFPVNADQGTRIDFSRVLAVHAICVGILWLILIPSLLVALHSKPMRQSMLSATAATFSYSFSWLLRPILFLSTIFVPIGYSFWYNENSGGLGALFSILLVMISFALPLSFALGALSFVLKSSGETRRRLLNKLLLPGVGALMSLVLGASIIVYLIIRPEGLSNVPLRYVVVIALALLSLVGCVIGIQAIAAALQWRHKQSEIADALNGQSADDAVIEIPFRQNSLELPIMGISDLIWKTIFQAPVERLHVINAADVGQATSVRPTNKQHTKLAGVVVIIQRQDLLRSKIWEFISLCNWIREIYGKTWSPIWIVGDWIGELLPENKSIKRKLELLDSLNAQVSGLENISAPSGSIFGVNPPSNILSCLKANQLVAKSKLLDLGLPAILRDAPTPLAIMLRSIFAQPHIANRLDAALRCAETAISMITLIFASEYEGLGRKNDRIEKALKICLPKPTFGSWTSLLYTFIRNSNSELVVETTQNLHAPAPPEVQELRAMVDMIGGKNALKSVAPELGSTMETLSLLVATRNVITAHGPAIESAAHDLYRAALVVAMNLLNSFQWRFVTFQANLPSYTEIKFRGCLPEITENRSPTDAATRLFVGVSDSMEPREIDVSKFFRLEKASTSLVIYADENRYVEPVSGLYESFD